MPFAFFSAARATLVIQNAGVAVCALILIGVMKFDEELRSIGPWAIPASQGLIVLIAVVAALACKACDIIVGKDWIVVISSNDRALLASEFVVRTID